MNPNPLISIVVPVHDEEKNVPLVYAELVKVLGETRYGYEIIFVDDGSTDHSVGEIEKLAIQDTRVKLLEFSRNFGKEIATSAGIKSAQGDAVIMVDADLQHPPHKILEFLKKWEEGAEVVIGVRNQSKSEGTIKRVGSYFFYKIINIISDTKSVPQATDFRLLDRKVADEFNRFTEKNRITRGLIDWLGFRREYVRFDADERIHGKPSYSTIKLTKLALCSFVSMSLLPLKLTGYLGIIIIAVSGPLGLFIFIQKYIVNDPWGFSFSGPAILTVILLFLVGIILTSLGLIALYIANIQTEVNNRPMYVIRKR